MDTIIEILPNRLLTTEEVAKALKKNPRTVQQIGKAQIIKSTLEARPGGGSRRMYEPESVGVYLRNPGQLKPKPERRIAAPAGQKQTALALRSDKPQIDTMNVFVSLIDKQHKANEALLSQMETQAKLSAEAMGTQARIAADSLKDVVAQIFAAQKADRDDERYRFDAQRQDRQERLKSRHTHGAPPTKRKA